MNARVRTAVVALSLLVVLYVGLGAVLGRTAGEGAYAHLAVFSEVFSHIQTDYVEDPNLPRVTVGALRGLLEALDPYSAYFSPREFAEYKQSKQKAAAGDVGLVLSKRVGLVTVVTVLPESPAARAGFTTGDLLESIAGFSTREMSVEQAYVLLAGEPNTSVRVAVIREQRAEPQTMELVRARLKPARVLSARLEGDIGYLKVASLETGKATEMRAALEGLKGQGVNRLVLDLRDCATGAPEEGVEATRLFLSGGLITYAEGQKYPRQSFNAVPEKAVWKGPVTVLINNGTAGPAEIVAAALLDNKRGDAVGQRSYGVGSVQKLIPLDDGSGLLLSVAKYYRPSGRAIPDQAVVPNVGVELTAEQSRPVPHSLPAPGDPVVTKALEVLRGEPVRRAA